MLMFSPLDLEENDFVPFFDESILSMNPELSNLPSSLEASAAPPHEMLIRGKDFEDDANRHSRRSVSSGVFSIREVDEDNEEDDQITNCDDKSAGMPTAVPSSAPSAHSASSIRRTSMLRAPLSKRTSISLVATTNERFLDI